jgi:putative permease
VLHPAVTLLRRWLPGWVAILVVVVAATALVGLVGYRGVAELAAQYEVIRDEAFTAALELEASAQFGEVASEFGLVDKTNRFFENLPVVLAGGDSDGGPAAAVQSAASSGSALFAIATLAVLWLISGTRFVRGGLSQIDDPIARQRIGALVIGSYHASCRYVWLMAGRAVVVGVIGGLACAALGLTTPTALGVAIGAGSIIPGIGIVLAVIPIGVYVVTVNPLAGIVFIAAAVVVQGADTVLIQRRINEIAVHVGPTATLVALLVGLQLYGFGGLLVGLAVAIYAFAVLRYLIDSHDEVLIALRRLLRGDEAIGGGPPRGGPVESRP